LVRNGWCEVISLIFLSPFLFGHTEEHIEKLKTTHIINFMYVSATSHLAIYNFKIVGWGGLWRDFGMGKIRRSKEKILCDARF